MYSLPQCCGAQIIYFQLHFFPLFWLRLQLQPYIATYKCTITVVPCENMSQWRLKLVFLHPSILQTKPNFFLVNIFYGIRIRTRLILDPFVFGSTSLMCNNCVVGVHNLLFSELKCNLSPRK